MGALDLGLLGGAVILGGGGGWTGLRVQGSVAAFWNLPKISIVELR